MSSPEWSSQGSSGRHQARNGGAGSQEAQLDVSLELAYSCPGPFPPSGSEPAPTFLLWDAACLPIMSLALQGPGTQQTGLGFTGPCESRKAGGACGLGSHHRAQQRPGGWSGGRQRLWGSGVPYSLPWIRPELPGQLPCPAVSLDTAGILGHGRKESPHGLARKQCRGRPCRSRIRGPLTVPAGRDQWLAGQAWDPLQMLDTGGLLGATGLPWVASPTTLRPEGGLPDSRPSRTDPRRGSGLTPLGRTPGEASPGVCGSGSPLPELLGLGRSWGHSAGLSVYPTPPPQCGLAGGGDFVQGLSPGFWLKLSLLVPEPLAFPPSRTGYGVQPFTHSFVHLPVIAELLGPRAWLGFGGSRAECEMRFS